VSCNQLVDSRPDDFSDDDLADQNAAAEFRSPLYRRHNQRRQEHLASLGLNLTDKRVLELGAGIGDHTTFFTDRGCSVISIEPRPENCRLFRANMASLGISSPDPVDLIESSFEGAEDLALEAFDVVYAYGVLYHLTDPARGLAFMARHCAGILLLETCVSFGSEQAINLVAEGGPSQAITGTGCRPTRTWVWSHLSELFPYVYATATQPAHPEFPLNWHSALSNESFTRSVFAAAQWPIDNPLLLADLPMTQRR
jgi:SAM-dependent methyltransferase